MAVEPVPHLFTVDHRGLGPGGCTETIVAHPADAVSPLALSDVTVAVAAVVG